MTTTHRQHLSSGCHAHTRPRGWACSPTQRRNRLRARRPAPAFSLIELLVVIAILALLVSILMPSLAAARRLARQAVCASNIRQLCFANHGYAMENGDYYVRAGADLMGSNLHRWHGRRDARDEAFEPRLGDLRNYLADGALKRCPSLKNVLTSPGQVGAGFEAGCGGYGYNNQYVGGRNDLHGLAGFRHSARVTDVRAPADTVLFTDAAFLQGTAAGLALIEYSFSESPFWHMTPGSRPSNLRPSPTIHFRHLDTTAVSWADGHADFQKLTFSAPYTTHSQITAEEAARRHLGWFGPQSNHLFDLE